MLPIWIKTPQTNGVFVPPLSTLHCCTPPLFVPRMFAPCPAMRCSCRDSCLAPWRLLVPLVQSPRHPPDLPSSAMRTRAVVFGFLFSSESSPPSVHNVCSWRGSFWFCLGWHCAMRPFRSVPGWLLPCCGCRSARLQLAVCWDVCPLAAWLVWRRPLGHWVGASPRCWCGLSQCDGYRFPPLWGHLPLTTGPNLVSSYVSAHCPLPLLAPRHRWGQFVIGSFTNHVTCNFLLTT